MMAKFLSIAMAAGLIVGSAALLHAQESGTPGSRIQGGGTAGAPGFAPGRGDTTGAGDRDDRMGPGRDDRMRDNSEGRLRNDGDDRTTGAGERDDRMFGHEHDEGR